MNFNYSTKADYTLIARQTDEIINLYGILVKLLLVEKINSDDLVFGDFSHIKTDSNKSYDIYALPETSESWDNININFSEYGMQNTETINLFISRKTIDTIFGKFDADRGFEGILGNLLVLPNNRIVEISDIDFTTPGSNNVFTSDAQKNVYNLTCTTYNHKLVSETPSTDLGAVDVPNYETLDDYFAELTDEKTNVDTEADVTPDVETGDVVIDNSEDSVFGRF